MPHPPHGLAIALGSNLGDRFKHLQLARQALEEQFGRAQVSPVYQTEPVGCPAGSLPFLNAVAYFPNCTLPPREVLALTQSMETARGRLRKGIVNAPRTVDLDLLFYGESVVDTPALQLPHPRLHLRRFVLQPLADVCPQHVLPGLPHTVAEMLATLNSPEPPLRLFVRFW